MKIKQMLFLILLLCSVVPLVFLSVLGMEAYNGKIEKLLRDNLENVAKSQIDKIEEFFEQRAQGMRLVGNYKTLETLLTASNRGQWTEAARLRPYIDDLLSARCRAYENVESLTIIDRNFVIVSSSFPVQAGQISKLKGKPLPREAGKVLFTNVAAKKLSSHNREVFVGILPVYFGGELQGYVVEELNLAFFDELREQAHMMETECLYLVDGNKQLVMAGNPAMTTAQYLDREIDTADFFTQWTVQGAEKRASGFLKYRSAGEQYLTYYWKLGNPQWQLYVSVNLDQMIRKENALRRMFVAVLTLLAALVAWGNYLVSRRIARPIESMIAQIRQIERARDVRRKIEGMPKNEIGSIADAFNLLLSFIERNTEALRRSREKYNIVMNQTNNIFLEWDLRRDTLQVSGRFEQVFGYPFPAQSLAEGAALENIVHPQDWPRYRSWIAQRAFVADNVSMELRLRTQDGTFRWMRLALVPLKDAKGAWSECIGLMSDIDKERQKAEALKARARIDSLTGLLNKGAAEDAIRRIVEEKRPCALLFIDIDDIKDFNTNYGHLYGDQVLRFVADILRAHVKGVLGRVGGDEFVGCVTDAAEISALEETVRQMLTELAAGQECVPVHCSVGIARYPEDAALFEELLQKADAAMYEVKENGKGSYRILR